MFCSVLRSLNRLSLFLSVLEFLFCRLASKRECFESFRSFSSRTFFFALLSSRKKTFLADYFSFGRFPSSFGVSLLWCIFFFSIRKVIPTFFVSFIFLSHVLKMFWKSSEMNQGSKRSRFPCLVWRIEAAKDGKDCERSRESNCPRRNETRQSIKVSNVNNVLSADERVKWRQVMTNYSSVLLSFSATERYVLCPRRKREKSSRTVNGTYQKFWFRTREQNLSWTHFMLAIIRDTFCSLLGDADPK